MKGPGSSQLVCWMMAVAAALSSAEIGFAAEKPNVIVILMDDMGYGDLSCTGNKNYQTPNIDQIASEGVRLESFYVCPLCAPTRAEFLTGRYHTRGGVQGVSTGEERLNPDEETIAEVFKSAGYRTGLFGKWHNGSQFPYHPNGQGFDEFYGFTSGHWGQYFDPVLEHNAELTRGEGYVTTDFTTKMLDFAKTSVKEDQPFLAYLAYCVPHAPMQVDRDLFNSMPKELESRHMDPDKEDVDFTRAALAMVKEADRHIGRILEFLKDSKLDEKTIVVYFSDNGPNSWRFNQRMKGKKGSTDEGGVRVPCFFRWTDHLPAGQVDDQLAGAIDLLPTLTELCGIKYSPKRPLDGISLVHGMKESNGAIPDRILFSSFRKNASARTQDFILDQKGDLYDRINDKSQSKKLNKEHPEVVARMIQAVEDWKKELGIPLPPEERSIPVGHREYPLTRLPARDATLSGHVARSSKHPNCSYITGWTGEDALVSYPLEIACKGDYEVTLHYCCPEGDLGAKMALRIGEEVIRFDVNEAFNSPLIGTADDVVPRPGESLVKDFKPWTIGTISLEPGHANLEIKAEEIPAGQAIEIRWVELKLK